MASTPSRFNLQKQDIKIEFAHPSSSTRLKDLAENPENYTDESNSKYLGASTELTEYDHPYDLGIQIDDSQSSKKQLRIAIPEKPKKRSSTSNKRRVVVEQQPIQEIVQVKQDVSRAKTLFIFGFIFPLIWLYVWTQYKNQQKWSEETQTFIQASKLMFIVYTTIFVIAIISFIATGSMLYYSGVL